MSFVEMIWSGAPLFGLPDDEALVKISAVRIFFGKAEHSNKDFLFWQKQNNR